MTISDLYLIHEHHEKIYLFQNNILLSLPIWVKLPHLPLGVTVLSEYFNSAIYFCKICILKGKKYYANTEKDWPVSIRSKKGPGCCSSNTDANSGPDTDQGSWPPLINRNSPETRQEIQGRLYGGPCCRREEREQATRPLVYLLAESRVGLGSGLGWGQLRHFAHPPASAVGRRHNQCFCSWLFRSGSRHFWSFCIFSPEFIPTAHTPT